MRLPSLLVVALCAICGSSTLRAQVAVAVTIADKNPTLRDVAAGVVDVVDDGWLMLRPQLAPTEVAACRVAAPCLQAAAKASHASHLLVIGIASVGVRDYVVSLQLYDDQGKKLVDENAVKTASGDPFADGRSLAGVLVVVPGMPAAASSSASSASPSPLSSAAPSSSSSLLGIAGVGLVGGGVVVGFLGAATFLGLGASPDSGYSRDRLVPASALAVSGGVALAVAGAVCVVVDGLD